MLTGFDYPFEALLGIQRALESRRASDWLGTATTGAGTFPPINVFQKGDDFIAVIELPGIDKNDLNIVAKENTIRISGRKTIAYDQGASMHRRERVSGVFDRTISVPMQIDPGAVTAEYRDGVLALSIPRAQSDKPRTVEIR